MAWSITCRVTNGLMDNTLKNVDRAEPYIDDICVHSPTFDQHLVDLESTFQALEKSSVQLRREKCFFGSHSIEFIGHIVSEGGHSPTPRLVEKIQSAPIPKGKKELQRFLGMANFYRDHVPGYARIAEPLYELTQKTKLWEWNDDARRAYNTLKSCLSETPLILAYPNWRREFILQTDASYTAIGAVLSQYDGEGTLRPISYFSSALTSAQRNYSAGELECWALVAASRKFQKYLQAAPSVKFLSDHNPLVWLKRQKDTRGKFTRWVQELETFNYQVIYVRGKDNVVADCLSRMHSEVDKAVNNETENFERHIYNLNMEGNLNQMLKQAQEDDQSTRSSRTAERDRIHI